MNKFPEDIKKHIANLHKLVEDPHPGLGEWVLMYGEEMNWLSNYWNVGLDYANRQLQLKAELKAKERRK